MRTGASTDTDYLGLFLRLWPRGIFSNAMHLVGRPLHALLWGLSAENSRIHNRVIDAWTEADPRATTETAGAWETTCGIEPADVPVELEDRRTYIWAKYTATGGNNPSRFVTLAANLGITAEITIPYGFPARVEESRIEDRLEGLSSRFIWLVDYDTHAHGVPGLSEKRGARLERMFAVYAPAHIAIEYDNNTYA